MKAQSLNLLGSPNLTLAIFVLKTSGAFCPGFEGQNVPFCVAKL